MSAFSALSISPPTNPGGGGARRPLNPNLAPHLGAAILLHLAALGALVLVNSIRTLQESQNPTQEPLWIELENRPAQRIVIQESNRKVLDPSFSRPNDSSLLSDRNQRVKRQTRASDLSAPLSRLGARLGAHLGALSGLSGRSVQDEIRSVLQESPSGLDDPSIPLGAETLLNTQQSIYYSFYSRLYQAIAPVWQSRIHQGAPGLGIRPLPGRYTTRVAVKLDSEGNLKELRILEASPLDFFDQVVVESWKKIRQFPNPPAGLKDQFGNVQTFWNFTVEIGQGQGWNLLPPRRI